MKRYFSQGQNCIENLLQAEWDFCHFSANKKVKYAMDVLWMSFVVKWKVLTEPKNLWKFINRFKIKNNHDIAYNSNYITE